MPILTNRPRGNFRTLNLWLHRYLGLFTALFLLLTGVSGSLLVYEHTLDDWFNQKLAYVAPPPHNQAAATTISAAQTLPIAVLHDKVSAAYPKLGFSSMPVRLEMGKAAVFSVDRQRGKPNAVAGSTLTFHTVYVNPYTGEIIGTRNRDTWAWQNTMPKVFWFHRNLLMGDVGQLILGISALLWTLNCFIGLYLTLPNSPTAKKKPPKGAKNANNAANARPLTWLKKWSRAWRIRKFSSWFKFNFDLHHAFGLWFWLLALAIAWSSVGFNLRVVYQPVMAAVFGIKANTPPVSQSQAQSSPKQPESKPVISMTDSNLRIDKYHAIDTLTALAQTHSQAKGKHYEQALGIRWVADDGAWQLRFKTDEDVGIGRGASSLTVNALTGEVTKVNFGDNARFGSKLEQWWHSLHMGHFDSALYRLLLAVFGLITAIMSVTGVYLWWRGRQTRKKITQKAQQKRQQNT